jgi:hypothetical protein
MASHHPQAMDLRQTLVRSCAEEGIGPRAVPLHHTTIRAYQVSGGRTYGINETWHSLADAVAGVPIVRLLNHKDSVIFREEGARGVRMHVYRVKQKSRARYVVRDHIQRAVRDLYLEEVCAFDGGVIAA